jgi:hypothetical protein
MTELSNRVVGLDDVLGLSSRALEGRLSGWYRKPGRVVTELDAFSLRRLRMTRRHAMAYAVFAICVGVALGVALDNVAVGVALGVALGVAFSRRAS